MWWISAVTNAIGILGGFLHNDILMYIMFGCSFLAFGHKYAKVFWRLVYEKIVDPYTDNVGDAFLANEFNGIWVLFAVYVLMVKKIGRNALFFSPFQGLIMWVVHKVMGKEVGIHFLVFYTIEFVITIMVLG